MLLDYKISLHISNVSVKVISNVQLVSKWPELLQGTLSFFQEVGISVWDNIKFINLVCADLFHGKLADSFILCFLFEYVRIWHF